MTEKHAKRVLGIEKKVANLKRKADQNILKDSLNLLEVTLGDDVMDAEKKKLTAKIKHVKEDLEIEQKNNINLRAKIFEKEEKEKELKKQLEEAKKAGKEQVTDEELATQNEELMKQVEELERKKKDVEVQIGDIRKRFRMSYTTINEMKKEKEDMQKYMEVIESNVENLKKELKEKEKEIEEVKKQKGQPIGEGKSTEDYQKDLATGNKENERLNSLLEEERWKVEALEKKIADLTEKTMAAERKELEAKIKMNLISQQLKSREETKHLIDAVVEDPKVTEFGTQGGVRSFSFRHLFSDGLANNLTKVKTKTESDLEKKGEAEMKKEAKGQKQEKIEEVEKFSEKRESEVAPRRKVAQNQPEKVIREGDKKMTININKISITTYNMISPTSQRKPGEVDLERTAKSLESNKLPSPKINFKTKLSESFDLKSIEEKPNSKKSKKSKKEVSEKKSELMVMYLEDDDSEEDSSITSLIQNPSPRNSRGNHLVPIQEKVKDDVKMKNDLDPVPKNHGGSTGNMIVKNLRPSVNSMNEDSKNGARNKNLSKSLFALKLNDKEIEEPEGTLAKGEGSFNFGDKKNSIDLNQSESFDDMFIGRKEMDSGDFLKEENNAFEVDQNLHIAMIADDAEIGEDVSEVSTRYIAKTKEKSSQKKDKGKEKPKPKVVTENSGNLLVPINKNLFDQSFQNESFAFASNPREPSMLMPPAQILNTNQSFAGDKIAFGTGMSFSTNNEVNNLLDCILEDSKKNDKEVKHEREPKVNVDLTTVPEETNIEDDFKFELPMKFQQNQKDEQFDSTNSLMIFGDLLNKKKSTENKEAKLLDIVTNFGTDNFDQNILNNVFGTKKIKHDHEDSVSPSMQSPNGSTDGMFFAMKRIDGGSDDEK